MSTDKIHSPNATPDLLEAAKDLLERVEYHCQVSGLGIGRKQQDKLRAAIAKAEGEK